MIITRLAGGLGNQMFNYAIARSYQQQRNPSEKIVLDTRLLKELETDIEKIFHRPFALSIFKNLQAGVMSKDLHKVLSNVDTLSNVRRRLFKRKTEYVVQDFMKPIAFHQSDKKNVFLIGYFQSDKSLLPIREQLITEFAFPDLDEHNENIKNQILQTSNALSVHIRRGDYLSSSNSQAYTSVNLDYYKNAISYLHTQISDEYIETFIFTDDINWVKQNFKTDKLNISFVEGNDGADSWKDMCLMSCCQHHIIANSSFSWWGAWLSVRNGITLAPKYWFRPDTHFYDIDDIIPRSWIVVDYILE